MWYECDIYIKLLVSVNGGTISVARWMVYFFRSEKPNQKKNHGFGVTPMDWKPPNLMYMRPLIWKNSLLDCDTPIILYVWCVWPPSWWIPPMLDDWLVVTGTMEFFMTFHSVGNSNNVIIPTDEVHDFSGRSTTNQTKAIVCLSGEFHHVWWNHVKSCSFPMFDDVSWSGLKNHVKCLMMFHVKSC